MNKEIEKSNLLNEVINYLINDEKRHYYESEKPKDHIYLKLLKLKKLNG